jgi:hypothetical protein
MRYIKGRYKLVASKCCIFSLTVNGLTQFRASQLKKERGITLQLVHLMLF